MGGLTQHAQFVLLNRRQKKDILDKTQNFGNQISNIIGPMKHADWYGNPIQLF